MESRGSVSVEEFEELKRYVEERTKEMMVLIEKISHAMDVQQHEVLARDEDIDSRFASIEQMREEMNEYFESQKQESLELLQTIEILSKTLDNETYERSVQGEEVQKWISDAMKTVEDVKLECSKQGDLSDELVNSIDQLKKAVDRGEKERLDFGLQIEGWAKIKDDVNDIRMAHEQDASDTKEMIGKLGEVFDLETRERVAQAEKLEAWFLENKEQLEQVRQECRIENQAMSSLLVAVQNTHRSLSLEVQERLGDNDQLLRCLEEASVIMKEKEMDLRPSLERLRGALSLPRPIAEIDGAGDAAAVTKEALCRFRVDGSRIPKHASRNSGGLAYRRTPTIHDKDAYSVAPWGSYVMGTKEGAFIKVGKSYLPTHLFDEQVMVEVSVDADEEQAEESHVRSDSLVAETAKSVALAARRMRSIQARSEYADMVAELPEPETKPDSAAPDSTMTEALNSLVKDIMHDRAERILLFTKVVDLEQQMATSKQASETQIGKDSGATPDTRAAQGTSKPGSRVSYNAKKEDSEHFVGLSHLESRLDRFSKDLEERLSTHESLSEEMRVRLESYENLETLASIRQSESRPLNNTSGTEARLQALAGELEERLRAQDVRIASGVDIQARLQDHEKRIISLSDARLSQGTAPEPRSNGNEVPIAVLSDLEARVQDHEKKMSNLTDRFNAQVVQTDTFAESMQSHKQQIDELSKQQASLQSSLLSQLSDAKSSLHNELKELISSHGSLPTTLPSDPDSSKASSVAGAATAVDGASDGSALTENIQRQQREQGQQIAVLQSQVLLITQKEPISRVEFQEAFRHIWQTIQPTMSAGNGINPAGVQKIHNEVASQDSESNNRKPWEAGGSIKESKQIQNSDSLVRSSQAPMRPTSANSQVAAVPIQYTSTTVSPQSFLNAATISSQPQSRGASPAPFLVSTGVNSPLTPSRGTSPAPVYTSAGVLRRAPSTGPSSSPPSPRSQPATTMSVRPSTPSRQNSFTDARANTTPQLVSAGIPQGIRPTKSFTVAGLQGS